MITYKITQCENGWVVAVNVDDPSLGIINPRACFVAETVASLHEIINMLALRDHPKFNKPAVQS